MSSVGFLSTGARAPARTLASLDTVAAVRRIGLAVNVEADSGAALGLDDDAYRAMGAAVFDRAEVWRRSDVLFPYRAPIGADHPCMTPDHVVFGYMHAEGNPGLCDALISSRATAYALEFVADRNGDSELTAVEAMISGQLAVIQAAYHLQKSSSGRGRLLSAIPGSRPTRVLVLGNSRAGRSAAVLAAGMGAHVTQLGRDENRLAAAMGFANAGVTLEEISAQRVTELLPESDVVIGTVLISDWDTPSLIDHEALRLMRPGSVIVDVTCGYGSGYLSTFPRFTFADDPFDVVDGVVHIKIDGLPEQVPVTASDAAARFMGPAMIDFLRWLTRSHRTSRWTFEDAKIIANGTIMNEYVARSYARISR